MTPATIQARADARRRGEVVPLDRAEGQAMADRWLTGMSVASIAELHGVPRARVQRRIYSLGCYSTPRDPQRRSEDTSPPSATTEPAL